MSRVIIYQNDDGGVSIVYPTPEVVATYGIEAVAKKDVPAGKPYKIVEVVDLPSDHTMQDVWTVDEADLTDGIGGESNEFD